MGESYARSEISGVAVITIPVTEYAALLNCRRKLAESDARQRAFNVVSKSPIERDPEVAAFIASRFGLATVPDIREECRALFGATRTPTQSSTYRYWARLRG